MFRCFRKSWLAILGIAFATVLIFAVVNADGRAGGGEGYSGGGSGSGGGGGHYGGGGGGGGNGGGLVIDLIFFGLTHPVAGLLIVIIFVVLYFYFQQNGGGPSQQQADAPLHADRLMGAITQLRSHDPSFDPGAFCNRVATAFPKVQAAWCAQDLKSVRPFISDGVHERFSLQFAEQKAEGYCDHMDDIRIGGVEIVAIASGDIYDSLSVLIRASAVDYPVSIGAVGAAGVGRKLSGSSMADAFAEVWTFLRRRGAATVTGKPGLLEGNCPNCAALITVNESTNCPNCGALLRSGEYDWVLVEITQQSEWRNALHAPIAGLGLLRQRDPNVNAPALEDRTSVIFWRKTSADRIGKIDPMRKVTSPPYADAYAVRLRAAADGQRTYFGDCAVGAVNTLKVIPATADLPIDRVLMEVRWSGFKMATSPGSSPKKMGDNDSHHTMFVLMRKADARTDVAKGISSAHCPNCGAPETGGIDGACEFCGTTLNDGSVGWVLDDILGFSDPKAQQLLALPVGA